MKSTHRNFPDSLLQQYNFDTNTTGAPTEASEEANATDEQKAKVKSKDVEPSDQPEEEGDKFAINNSPTEADDDYEKEREEPSIKTHSKTRKMHIIQEYKEEEPEEEPLIPVLSRKARKK